MIKYAESIGNQKPVGSTMTNELPTTVPPALIEDRSAGQWMAIRARLRTEIGKDPFDAFCGAIELQSRKGGMVTLSVPNHFLKRWVSDHYAARLSEMWKEHGVTRIEIVMRSLARGALPRQKEALAPNPKVGVFTRVTIPPRKKVALPSEILGTPPPVVAEISSIPPDTAEPTKKVLARAKKPRTEIVVPSPQLPKYEEFNPLSELAIMEVVARDPTRFTVTRVVAVIARVYQVTELQIAYNYPLRYIRDICVYLSVLLTLQTQREVARQFAISEATVTKALQRIRAQIEKDSDFARVIEVLKRIIVTGD